MTLEDMTNVKQTDTHCCPSLTQLYNDYFATPPHNEKKTFAVQINKKKHMPPISDMYRCEMMQYLEKQTKPSTIYDNTNKPSVSKRYALSSINKILLF